jgi:hypothetical protein
MFKIPILPVNAFKLHIQKALLSGRMRRQGKWSWTGGKTGSTNESDHLKIDIFCWFAIMLD